MSNAIDIAVESLTEEQLGSLVDRIDQVPAGRNLLRKKFENLPPASKGRVEREERPFDWLTLRLEFVPCGKAKCRKTPDEHGPYWYSYRLVAGHWKREYHGRNRPEPEDFWTIERAEECLSKICDASALDDAQVTDLEKLAGGMAALSADPRAAELQKRARSVLVQERKRREESIRQRYEYLSSKRNADAKLTAEEKDELSRLGRILAEDH